MKLGLWNSKSSSLPSSPNKSTKNAQEQPEQSKRSPLKTKKSIVFEAFKQKDTLICKFCGGKTCKLENYLTNPDSAIKGLNSDWVTNNILATQRPSSRLIKQFDIIKQFKEKGINAIFNLQEPGEHSVCGDGIHPSSGFSYNPEEFSDHGIYFFNFGWRDMTATSTDVVLKILKQMSFSLTNGNKVAVHCHAGRGRTGLIIAAWLIFHDHMSAKDAIKLLRARRKDSISKKSQEKLLFQFEKEIKESRQIFFFFPKYGLNEYLFHQKKLYALSINSAERYVPKLVLVVLERLEILTKNDVCRLEDVLSAFHSLNERECFTENWDSNHEKFLKTFKERVNGGNYEVSDIEDPRYLVQILLDFLEGFASPPIENRFIDAVNEKIHESQSKLTKDIKDQFFKELNRKEFFLLECFARFFASARALTDSLNESIARAALRVCISLTSTRKKLDRLFFRRNLIADHDHDDQVTHLKIFLSKWIENFNEEFTQNFMVHKSTLKITEKKVKQRLINKGINMNTYLNKVLDSKEVIEEDSPSSPEPSSKAEVQTNDSSQKSNLPQLSLKRNSRSQNNSISGQIPVLPLSKDSPHQSMQQINFAALTRPNSSSRLKEAIPGESSLTTPKPSLILGTPLPSLTMQRGISAPKYANEGEATPSSKARQFRQPIGNMPFAMGNSRKSLLKLDENSKIQENVSALAKINIERHYNNFFGQREIGQNIQEEEESLNHEKEEEKSSRNLDSKKEEEEAVGSLGSDNSDEDLVKAFKEMNAERQDVLLKKLLEIQSLRNSNNKILVN